jgi:HSP20 family protein
MSRRKAMGNESKRDVPVTTKGQEVKKGGAMQALNPFADMERAFERFMSGWMRPLAWERPLWRDMMGPFQGRMPSIDVIDRDEDFLVRAEVPGVDKKELEVSLADNMLTVKGKVQHEQKEERPDYYRCEITQGAFSRTVLIPGKFDASKVEASLKDGVLEVTLPKVEVSKRRAIKID